MLKSDQFIDVKDVLSSNHDLEGGEGNEVEETPIIDPIAWLA
tara:strand:- start:1269 stop:1394 length:126 start_codon:yes stop_codon:yes gene_type:complete